MCQLASFVLTKDQVYWSRKTDSHTEIIAEHNLHEDGPRGPNVVKIEISPPGGDMTRPLAEWAYRVDRDIMPEWFDRDDCEARGRKALVDWHRERVIAEGSHHISDGRHVLVCGNARAILYDQSSAELRGQSSAELYGNSRAELYDQSSAELYDQSSAELCGQSRAVLYGNSRANLYDQSSAVLCGNSRAKLRGQSSAVLYGNSRAELYGQSSAELYGQSRAGDIRGHATARFYDQTEPIRPTGPYAVAIDCRGEKALCLTGGEDGQQ